MPGLAVFYLRRRHQRDAAVRDGGGAADEAQAAIEHATGAAEAPAGARVEGAEHDDRRSGLPAAVRRANACSSGSIGTAGAWALLDFCYYGNTISTPEILKLLNPHASLLHNTLVQLAIFAIFAVPGYIVAILLLDKTGVKYPGARLRHDGADVPADRAHPGGDDDRPAFALLYGISYFFTEFAPKTTFIYPAEIFPTQVRTTAHGISSGAGKLGAFLGAFLFPDFLTRAASAGRR